MSINHIIGGPITQGLGGNLKRMIVFTLLDIGSLYAMDSRSHTQALSRCNFKRYWSLVDSL